MPGVNPILDTFDGQAEVYSPGIESLMSQAINPGQAAAQGSVTQMQIGAVSSSQVNAAGTSENVAAHVAVFVIFALVGVYTLNHLGFRGMVAVGK